MAAPAYASHTAPRHARTRPLSAHMPSAAPAAAVPDRRLAPEAKRSPTKKAASKGKLTDLHGEPPLIIRRDRGGSTMRRGKMLGEGGFARVYEAVEETDGSLKAVKVISKQQLQSTKNRAKLFAEIKLHQAMSHPRVVRFEGCFEDDEHVYMTLQMCGGGSMLDVLRRRKRYTEPEARFYLVQLIGACEYMHGRSVIHRDLKLGNLLLDDDMNLCVADFGLAALVRFPGERKKTICGTPNYIAPEILFDQDNGHSFEVDVWSVGVILYTLLVGKPPFQTKDVKVIYKKIKANAYAFPDSVTISDEAVDLISRILNTDPLQRPTLTGILEHPFFHTGPFPHSIPPTARDVAPDFNTLSRAASAANFARARRTSAAVPDPPTPTPVATQEAITAAQTRVEKEARTAIAPHSPIAELLRSARKPLQLSPSTSNNANSNEPRDLLRRKFDKENVRPRSSLGSEVVGAVDGDEKAAARMAPVPSMGVLKPRNGVQRAVEPVAASIVKPAPPPTAAAMPEPRVVPTATTVRISSRELYEACWQTLELALSAKSPSAISSLPKPDVVTPRVFITSWVDYTHKYGTAYALTDGTAGFYFNDSSTMTMSPDKSRLDYISGRQGSTSSRRNYAVEGTGDDCVPQDLDRKVYLLQYFDHYMAQTLDRDVDWTFQDVERRSELDFLVKYYRMKNCIVFRLSNDVLQFNFFDHTKILLTMQGHAVTLIGQDYRLKTYPLAKLVREVVQLEALPEAELDARRVRKLDQVRFILTKLAYCTEVLRGLTVSRTETAVV